MLKTLLEKSPETPPMRRRAQVSLRDVHRVYRGGVRALSGLTLDVYEGEFLSLLGPSGCGKTTLLRLIAGLEVPDQGSIALGDRVVAGAGWVRPEERGVGIVFQDYALFPHLTVAENIEFGLHGRPRAERAKRVDAMLALAGIAGERRRYPHELSGGQQQRVALARALAPSPKVMLLDEPFSNLDADLRLEIGTETRRILKETGTTTILVTHDQEEAFSLSDRIGVLNAGRLDQVGTPYEVYHRPSTRFAANFVGRADFLPARFDGSAIVSDIGVFAQPVPDRPDREHVDLMVRPDDIEFDEDPSGDALIDDVRFLGPDMLYGIRLLSGRVVHSIRPSTRAFAAGTRVRVRVEPAHIVFFPGQGSEVKKEEK